MQQLVLASSSPYRQALLRRLELPFEVAVPNLDETAQGGETPTQTAVRLAHAKAAAVAVTFPQALIIGSDQVAECDGQPIGKPGNHENAVAQLRMMRGKRVMFHTALCLFNAKTGQAQQQLAANSVVFRAFSDAEIERYLRREQPYNCAGSAKSEGLGIVMVERFEGDDPNALVGLPLIALVGMLKAEGVVIP